MALSSNQETLWNDIVEIYNNINTARQKFSLNAVSIPSHAAYEVPIKSAHVTDLGTALTALNGTVYDSGSGASFNITIPTVSELVEYTPFATLNTEATNVTNTCIHRSSFRSHDSSFRSSHRSSFRSHNSSFNSSHRSSFDSSFRSSFRSHDSFGWYSFTANQAN